MNKIGIRKVSVLQGMAKNIADKHDLEPNDLVIVTVSLEKVIGNPVSYLLAQIEENVGDKENKCPKCESEGKAQEFNAITMISTCGKCGWVFAYPKVQSSTQTTNSLEIRDEKVNKDA